MLTISAKDIPAYLKGDNRRQKVFIHVQESVTVPIDAGLWSGGTREIYEAMRLDNGQRVEMVNHNASPFNGTREKKTFHLVPGIVVRKSGHFCGKPAFLTFYVHPDNAPKFLPAP